MFAFVRRECTHFSVIYRDRKKAWHYIWMWTTNFIYTIWTIDYPWVVVHCAIILNDRWMNEFPGLVLHKYKVNQIRGLKLGQRAPYAPQSILFAQAIFNCRLSLWSEISKLLQCVGKYHRRIWCLLCVSGQTFERPLKPHLYTPNDKLCGYAPHALTCTTTTAVLAHVRTHVLLCDTEGWHQCACGDGTIWCWHTFRDWLCNACRQQRSMQSVYCGHRRDVFKHLSNTHTHSFTHSSSFAYAMSLSPLSPLVVRRS